MADETTTVTDDKCEGFKTEWDPTVEECRECEKVYPEEYEECKRATKILKEKKTGSTEETLIPPDIPSEEIPLRPDTSSEESSKKEKPARMSPKTNIKQLCRKLHINKKKPDEEVLKLLAEEYVKIGKDEKYAKTRARATLNSVKKEVVDKKDEPENKAPKEDIPEKDSKK